MFRNPGMTSLRPCSIALTPILATLSAGMTLQDSTPLRLMPATSWKPVSTYPGQRQVTVTPVPLISECMALENESTYDLVAQYTAIPGPGWKAAIEATFSIRPLPFVTILSP